MAKIIGNTTATPMTIPDWAQTDSTKADYIKNKITKLSDLENDVFYSMIASGTAIPKNANLNTIDYITVGNYYCSQNDDVKTLTNCPTRLGFVMQVSSPLSSTIGDETSSNWVYRIRKIIAYTGEEYFQSVSSGSTAGEFSYGDWFKNINSTDVVTDEKNGLMTTAMATKLSGIADGATAVTVDSALNSTSENPVQNKVVYSALSGKANSSHGSHVEFESTTKPAMDGTAAHGSSTKVARADHVHPTDTSRASSSTLTAHTGSTTVHITSTERTNWNAAKTHADSAHNYAGSSSSGGAATKAIADQNNNVIDRVYCSMIPSGTMIPEKADLSTLDYIAVGNYYCTDNTIAATLTNCPTKLGFMMQVYSPLAKTIDNEDSSTWVYRIRKIMTYAGVEYVQSVSSGSTAGEFTYGPWFQNINSTDTATDSRDGLMTSSMVTKLNGIAAGATAVIVDSDLSSTSTNPVQNRIIDSALSGKANSSHSHLVADMSDLTEATSAEIAALFAE